MLKNDCKNIIINIGGKMKKTVLLIAIPIVVILFSVWGLLITKNTTNRLIKEQNSEYEYYLDKTVYGTDVTSIIGKPVDENEKNNIQKNEKGHSRGCQNL